MNNDTSMHDTTITINGVTLRAPRLPRQSEVLTSDALSFLAGLHRRFGDRIAELSERGMLNVTAGGECGTHASSWHAMIEKHLIEPPSTIVKPRGLGRYEDRMHVDGAPVSGGLMDYGIYIHRTAHSLVASGRAPYICLPEIVSEEEMHLWQELFHTAEEQLGLPDGTIRAIRMRPGQRSRPASQQASGSPAREAVGPSAQPRTPGLIPAAA